MDGLVTREQVEEREQQNLASYGMKSGDSRGRQVSHAKDPWRTEFQRDRDRIIHCSAFRRLDNKTQVFVSPKGGHFRTRLTHSLEVAQISCSVARRLGLNEDLCGAVALAHDLGHTPFGHSGGDVLGRLMLDHGGFEHNLQSLRIVDHLEIHYPGCRGLNLTYEVRESILKHNRPFRGDVFAAYHPEEGPLLEAQLVDLSDGIAYNSHDIDDGLQSGLLIADELNELAIMRVVRERVRGKWPGITGRMEQKKCIGELIDYLSADLVTFSIERIRQLGLKSLEGVREQQEAILGFSAQVCREDEELRTFLYEKLYTHYRVHQMRNRARVFIEGLFHEYIANPMLMPPRYQEWAADDGLERTVADYIAGMTDGYAQNEYQRLFNPFDR